MSQKSFCELCDMLRPYLEKKNTLRTSISAEAQIGSFLYYIRYEGCYKKKPWMLSEYLEHPFTKLSEEYSMLSWHF